MSGIFGIFQRDAEPIETKSLQIMQTKMAHWGPDGSFVMLNGTAGLGQSRMISTPEGQYEQLPKWDDVHLLAFTAAARLDNRDELLSQLIIDRPVSRVPDSEIIFLAYLKWGADCVRRIYGDWSFAVWDPQERKLFLARDHFGNTSLFYCLTEKVFAFASDSASLLSLGLPPKEMDELYLGQLLVSWPAYHGEGTIFKGLQRLPPAHTITVSEKRADTNQYWKMEEVDLLHLPGREDYVEPFRDVIEKSVSARLRHPAANSTTRGVGVTLSGGLDSSSITMTAAAILKKSGERLPAFTSIPYYEQSANIFSNRFGNELPYARASARQAGNVDLFTIDAAQISPIQSIRHSLEIHNEPAHAAGNFFWIQALQEKARDDGLRVLLTGQLGNAGLSWTGDKFSQSLLFQLRHMAINIWTKELLKRNLPARLLEIIKSQKASADWFLSSSINPDLAGRLNLHKLRLQDPVETPRTALEQRFQLLKPGNNFVGAIHAQNGAAFGLDVRDPSGDVRLLEFSLSVPDKVFIDPKTGIDRWLIRAAMEGRLPDEVRLNRRRGLQAADIIPRLRACAAEVDEALSEIDHGIGRNFVNVPNMRQIWQMVQTVETPKVSIKAQTVLTRGIMAGLWVNSNFA